MSADVIVKMLRQEDEVASLAPQKGGGAVRNPTHAVLIQVVRQEALERIVVLAGAVVQRVIVELDFLAKAANGVGPIQDVDTDTMASCQSKGYAFGLHERISIRRP